MSTRGFGVQAWFAIILSVVVSRAEAAASDRPPTTQPQGESSQQSSVLNSLRELYSLPRGTVIRRETDSSSERRTAKVTHIHGAAETDPGVQPDGMPEIEDREEIIEERAQLNEMFNEAQAMPPWGSYYRAGPRRSQREQDWTNYRYFGGQPGRYGYGRRYTPYHYDSAAGDAFRFGFLEGFYRGRFERDATEREHSLLQHHSVQLKRGLDHFHKGEYQQAAAAFKLAADTHHGDPASRIYAGHTLFAIGHYQQAITHLRRAFELQPKIPLLDYDVRDDYPKNNDFNQHLATLEAAVKKDPNEPNRLLLLGYVRDYANQRDKAYTPLARANRINRGDNFAERLMEHCRPPDVALENKGPQNKADR
jgi:tetratricopeptide (TPR) repeat protein